MHSPPGASKLVLKTIVKQPELTHDSLNQIRGTIILLPIPRSTCLSASLDSCPLFPICIHKSYYTTNVLLVIPWLGIKSPRKSSIKPKIISTRYIAYLNLTSLTAAPKSTDSHPKMRPLAVLALFFAALTLAAPVDEQNDPNEAIVPNDPVFPPDLDRCRRGYDQCVAVRNSLSSCHMRSTYSTDPLL